MTSEIPSGAADAPHDRQALIRDIAVLQVKLVFDSLRDVILVPVSLMAGVISLLRAGDPAGSEFYQLLKLGRRSERWINLFGAADRLPGPEREHYPEGDIDTLVSRVESLVVEEYRKGGVTKQAKDHLDRLLESVNRWREKRGRPSSS